MSTRQETEETMSAVGISLEGHDYKEIPDPEGDGVTRVWAKPGSMLASIMDEVVAESAKKKADDKLMAEQVRREIASGERPAEDEQFAACLEHSAYFDFDTLNGHGGSREEETPEYDASFAKGWNDFANIVSWARDGFDPNRYLQGVTEAIAEYGRKEWERAVVMEENRPDLDAICQAVERIKAAGIKIVAKSNSIDFDNGQGIRRVNGPDLFDDCPF